MSGIIGNFAAQPRVFGHDAIEVVVGAVNYLWPGDINGTGIGGYVVTTAGANYAVDETVSQVTVTPATNPAASGFEAKVAEIDENGGIVRLTITAPGAKYNAQFDNPQIPTPSPSLITLTTPTAGGSADKAQITITNIDIPGTHNRGVALLTENEGGAGSVVVRGIVESGREITITTPGASAPHAAPVGGSTPILWKRIITPGTAGKIVAIY